VNQPFFTELCLSGIHGFRHSADGYVATALLLSYFTANSWLTLVNSPLWELVPVLGKNSMREENSGGAKKREALHQSLHRTR